MEGDGRFPPLIGARAVSLMQETFQKVHQDLPPCQPHTKLARNRMASEELALCNANKTVNERQLDESIRRIRSLEQDIHALQAEQGGGGSTPYLGGTSAHTQQLFHALHLVVWVSA